MPKVNTLLRLIAYQKQRPQATDEKIGQGIGMSPRHVIRCRKEVNLLKHLLAEPYTISEILYRISSVDKI